MESNFESERPSLKDKKNKSKTPADKNYFKELNIIKQIGKGGFSKTFLIEDKECKRFALKKIIIDKTDLRLLDAIEKEIKFMQNISHPNIPKFYDSYKEIKGSDIEINIIQEYIEGKNLYEIINYGKTFLEKEVVDILIKTSKILEFLHNYDPQIIHRDIKPSNIMIDEKGRLFLIDFGAIKEKVSFEYTSKSGLSTIIGTQGYMPIEQFENRVNIQSDIYSLGLTAIYLLSKKEPLEFPKKSLSIEFEKYVNISSSFMSILKKMTDPDYTLRYKSISELKKDLYNIDEKKIILNSHEILDPYIESYIESDEKVIMVKKPEISNILLKKNILSVLSKGIISIIVSIILFIAFTIALLSSSKLFMFLEFYTVFILSTLFVGGFSSLMVGIGLTLTPIFSSIYSKGTKYILTDKKIIIFPKQYNINRSIFNLPLRIINTISKNLIVYGNIMPIVRELPTIIIRLLEGQFDPVEINEMEAKTDNIKIIYYSELKNYSLKKIQYKDGSGDLIFYDNKSGTKDIYMKLISVNDINVIEKFLIERFSQQ